MFIVRRKTMGHLVDEERVEWNDLAEVLNDWIASAPQDDEEISFQPVPADELLGGVL